MVAVTQVFSKCIYVSVYVYKISRFSFVAMHHRAGMHINSWSCTALCFFQISVLYFAEAQVNCPPFIADLLGTTDAPCPTGLIGDALAAESGAPSLPVSVQVHDSLNIVCLRSGRTQDTYSGVSVIVSYSCTGAPSKCTGNPILSQFEFECATGPTWTASVGGSASNIITTPPDGSLSTTLKTDCGVCVSPARSGFATITNNEQHCGCEYSQDLACCQCIGHNCVISLFSLPYMYPIPCMHMQHMYTHSYIACNSDCNTTQPSLMRCFGHLDSGCCNFFENDVCGKLHISLGAQQQL